MSPKAFTKLNYWLWLGLYFNVALFGWWWLFRCWIGLWIPGTQRKLSHNYLHLFLSSPRLPSCCSLSKSSPAEPSATASDSAVCLTRRLCLTYSPSWANTRGTSSSKASTWFTTHRYVRCSASNSVPRLLAILHYIWLHLPLSCLTKTLPLCDLFRERRRAKLSFRWTLSNQQSRPQSTSTRNSCSSATRKDTLKCCSAPGKTWTSFWPMGCRCPRRLVCCRQWRPQLGRWPRLSSSRRRGRSSRPVAPLCPRFPRPPLRRHTAPVSGLWSRTARWLRWRLPISRRRCLPPPPRRLQPQPLARSCRPRWLTYSPGPQCTPPPRPTNPSCTGTRVLPCLPSQHITCTPAPPPSCWRASRHTPVQTTFSPSWMEFTRYSLPSQTVSSAMQPFWLRSESSVNSSQESLWNSRKPQPIFLRIPFSCILTLAVVVTNIWSCFSQRCRVCLPIRSLRVADAARCAATEGSRRSPGGGSLHHVWFPSWSWTSRHWAKP